MTRKTIEQNWRDEAEAAKQEAASLPPGPEREALLKKFRQLNTASEMNGWLTSPGLKAPTDK
ncbi:MAG: hypothetical protein Q7V17_15755 [Afipia sp.]|nr:hypothetical protein [Afipia sp.]